MALTAALFWSAALLVLMGEACDARVTTVTPDHVRGLAAAGATHLQLVLDPVTAESIDAIGAALADLER